MELSRKVSALGFDSLFKVVEGDIKVSFDLENVAEGRDYFGPSGLMGLQSLETGMAFHGYCAGGDWQMPVFFLVYWDGHKLRAHVPYAGNLWNRKTRAAYGNDPEEDLRDIKARWPHLATIHDIDEADVSFDEALLLREILDTFEEKV